VIQFVARGCRKGLAERQSDVMARSRSGIPRTLGHGTLSFRFLVAVDVAGFSQRCAAEQARVQDDLDSVMMQAAASVGLDRERWYRQPRGDGDLAVLPQDVDGLSLVADYPRKLASKIADLNLADSGSRLRVRLAIHHGAVTPGRFGPVGSALVAISRLVDAEATKQQLRQRSDLDIALIVSASVYDEVIQSRLHNLDPEAFRRVIIRAKDISYVGYLYQENFGVWNCVIPSPREPVTAVLTGPLLG
jgi:hypothetical protein